MSQALRRTSGSGEVSDPYANTGSALMFTLIAAISSLSRRRWRCMTSAVSTSYGWTTSAPLTPGIRVMRSSFCSMDSGSWYSQKRSRSLPRNDVMTACFILRSFLDRERDFQYRTDLRKPRSLLIVCHHAQDVLAGRHVHHIPPFLVVQHERRAPAVAIGRAVDVELHALDGPARVPVFDDRLDPLRFFENLVRPESEEFDLGRFERGILRPRGNRRTGQAGHLLEEQPLQRSRYAPVHGRRLEAIPVVVQAVIVVAPAHMFLNGGMQVERAHAILVDQHGAVVAQPPPHRLDALVDLFGRLSIGVEHDVIDGAHGGLAAASMRHDPAGPAHRDRDLTLHPLLRQQYGVQRTVRLQNPVLVAVRIGFVIDLDEDVPVRQVLQETAPLNDRLLHVAIVGRNLDALVRSEVEESDDGHHAEAVGFRDDPPQPAGIRGLQVALRIEPAVVVRLQVNAFPVIAVRRAASLQVDGERQQARAPPVRQRGEELAHVPLGIPGPVGVVPKYGSERVGLVRMLPGALVGVVRVVEDRLDGANVEQSPGQGRIRGGKTGGRSVGGLSIDRELGAVDAHHRMQALRAAYGRQQQRKEGQDARQHVTLPAPSLAPYQVLILTRPPQPLGAEEVMVHAREDFQALGGPGDRSLLILLKVHSSGPRATEW